MTSASTHFSEAWKAKKGGRFLADKIPVKNDMLMHFSNRDY